MKYNFNSICQHQAGRLLNIHYHNTRENIVGEGVKLCRRIKSFKSVNPNTAQIAVTRQPNGQIISTMHDVAHCGNAHLCAYCSSLKSKDMRDWLQSVHIPAVLNAGLVNGLLTLTAFHKRDCNWTEFANNFFKALGSFSIDTKRDFDAIGSIGRVRAIETPVGDNGLHIHPHDLFTYKKWMDLDAFKKIILTKWKKALKKFDLRCSKNGVDIKVDGDFDPFYIAKEIAAHDTKTNKHKNGNADKDYESTCVTLFELLSRSARGNKQAGADWIRAAKALQGRDRFNVGMLAHKLGIPSPSAWIKPVGEAKTEPSLIIEYPQAHHMIATCPTNTRPGLAIILRTARQSLAHPENVHKMVLRMCDETIKANVVLIKERHAHKLANELSPSIAPSEKARLTAKYYLHCTFAIADYTAKTQLYMFPAPKPTVIPSVAASLIHINPGLELVFI